MGFFKVVLILLLVYYLFKILARWFGPRLFSYAVKRTEREFQQQFEQFQGQYNSDQSKVGDVSIEKKPTSNTKTSKPDIGEYIDFEEID
ncbi:DUF4834 family protein [Poritiphilus flavus]|uniref:DUF4834 family protein n=1 Tax=Poritiphilus flavus TaxID=2697053 RepID=A0A6L9EFG4_9FLAO|nr:DUF4834 family protein [Poritiphilus flavus]NAS13484.1 DUF4834 family protein [Poritiphilus flavus]